MSNVIFRVDANTRIGTGHVMRCLALAQEWSARGGEAVFVARELGGLEARLEAEGMKVVWVPVDRAHGEWETESDARFTIQTALAHNAAWVVVDGYPFDAAYQRTLKNAGLKTLYVDDNADCPHYYADIVLNQNLHADAGMYLSREPYTRLLLGSRYTLLRREFLKWRAWARVIPEVGKRILVTLGGSDPENVTLKVIRALDEMDEPGLEAVVVSGAANPHAQVLERAASSARFPIRIQKNVSDMPGWMAWTDLAIAGGGSTCWELAFMGLPNAVISLAANQDLNTRNLETRGMALNLGWYEALSVGEIKRGVETLLHDPALRNQMSQKGRDCIDGRGTARVVECLGLTPVVRLRKAREEDCRLLWEWANDPVVRESAFNTEPIRWATHQDWFERKLHSPQCHLYLALDEHGKPAGQARFDLISDCEVEMDISIDAAVRHSGYGSTLIKAAVEELFRTTPIHTVHAYIKTNNLASINTFERAKFSNRGHVTKKGFDAFHYSRVKQ